MFFLLYAVGLLVLVAGLLAGLAFSVIGTVFAAICAAVVAVLGALKAQARKLDDEAAFPGDRRKPAFPERLTQ